MSDLPANDAPMDPTAATNAPNAPDPSAAKAGDPKAVAKAGDPKAAANAPNPKGAAVAKAPDPKVAAKATGRLSTGVAAKAKAGDSKAAAKAPGAAAKAKAAAAVPDAKAEEMVWYQTEGLGEWAPCRVVSKDKHLNVTLKVKNKDMVVRRADVASPISRILPDPASVEGEEVTKDLCELERDGLGPEGIEESLRQNFCNSTPYTNIGDVLLVVNPMREMPIYDSSWINRYDELKPGLPPHIYNTSAMAFKALLASDRKVSQAILLTGRPGSGKSKAMSHMLGFLSQTAGDDPIDKQLGLLEVMLRPFISIRLERGELNWLSTRALLKLELSFSDQDDFICRAFASVHLLESRAARPGDGANFDVFGRAMKDRKESKQFLGEKEDFKLLGEDFDLEEYDKTGQELDEWKRALKMFDIDSAIVIRVLCGLLWLGEITFTANPIPAMSGTGVQCEGHKEAAKALGIEAADLAEGFSQATDVKVADEMLRDTIEDIYRALLAWILQKANSAMGSSSTSNGTITIIDTPSFPFGWPATLPSPAGFDAFQLQWLSEAITSKLLSASLHVRVQEKNLSLDVSDLESSQAAETALSAIGGLASTIRLLSKDQQAAPAYIKNSFESGTKDFSKKLGAQADRITVKSTSTALSCEISGSSGKIEHVLDNALVRGSLAPSASVKMKTALTQSSQPPVKEIIATRMEPAIVRSYIDDAEEAVSMVQGILQGSSTTRPWVICCMRPNDKGTDKLVSQSVLQAQAKELLLTDMVHMARSSGSEEVPYTAAWSLANFQRRYRDIILKVLVQEAKPDSRTDSEEAVRSLIRDIEGAIFVGSQGTVGAESVYGSQELQDTLKTRGEEAAERTRGKAADKVPPLALKELGQKEACSKCGATFADGSVMFCGKCGNKRRKKELVPRCTNCATEFVDDSAFCGSCGSKRVGSEDAMAGPKKQPKTLSARSPSPPDSDDEVMSLKSGKSLATVKSVGKSDGGKRGQLRSMASSQYASLHSALSQMAAVLRVAKESEASLRKVQSTRDTEVQELRQESDAWRVESDRLWVQVKELQQMVVEGGSVFKQTPQST